MDPPCSIEQLPNELLLDIFESLSWPNLWSATLVCSRWNALIGSSSKLMDDLTLRIDLTNYSPEYYSILSRSVRHYRDLVIQSEGERSFTVAVLTLRKLGPHLRGLRFMSCNTKPMPYSRMKELEVGLEEGDRAMWEQELDSFDRSLLPIDEYRIENERISPVLDQQLCDRQMVEIFCVVMYRYCARLERLTMYYGASFPLNHRTRFSLYEGNQMEHLKGMRIFETCHLVLAKSTSLQKLQLLHVIAGPPLYASLGQTFPMLTHLEIASIVFDDPCLWAVSKHCAQLEELLLSSIRITSNGYRYIHQLQQLRKLDTTNWECNFDVFEPLPVEILYIHSYEIKMETIYRMLRMNANMKLCKITAKRYTQAGLETFPLGHEFQEVRPTCETILSWG